MGLVRDVRKTTVQNALAEASSYWHAKGGGVNAALEREKCEHCGISIVEAISAGCVPVVYGEGGPKEIVERGVSGFFGRGGMSWGGRRSLLHVTKPCWQKWLGRPGDVVRSVRGSCL